MKWDKNSKLYSDFLSTKNPYETFMKSSKNTLYNIYVTLKFLC